MLWLATAALAADLAFTFDQQLDAGERPSFTVTAPVPIAELQLVITAGGQSYKHTFVDVRPKLPYTFDWARDPSVTSADVHLLTTFADGNEEEMAVHLEYSYDGALSVDLDRASADLSRRLLVVPVTARVDEAEVVAYGARKVELERKTVRVAAGPGPIEIPWVGGGVEDVVLLEVTVRSGGAWASFTFSPWFLDSPHQDVLFDVDAATIRPAEEPKLLATLAQLREVLDKYGSVVPVQLYIAGCTDTVGDAGHNAELSRARARAIASWLRAHGYDRPIWYHGFGESLLAVPTPDGTDQAANRRALYLVGANPPPPESGVPEVRWTAL